jgi:hypothetical protein
VSRHRKIPHLPLPPHFRLSKALPTSHTILVQKTHENLLGRFPPYVSDRKCTCRLAMKELALPLEDGIGGNHSLSYKADSATPNV